VLGNEISFYFKKCIESFEAFHEASQALLFELCNKQGKLRELVENVSQDEELFSLCEHYDILDKIVLFSCPDTGFRIRLHLFADGYFDRPHSHRWSYSSLILNGGYLHSLYVLPKNIENISSPRCLVPISMRREKKGDSYTLHYSQFHSVIAEPQTITLVVRGPAETDRFLVMDKVTDQAWWQYGAKDENAKERENKKMSLTQYQKALEKLKINGII
jgi:hypothetical protein